MDIKLTKKEKNFLILWLQDDLLLAIENQHSSTKYTIDKLKSILKKLTKKQRSKNG
jgi:cytochrome c oxidase assembly factor CtaG